MSYFQQQSGSKRKASMMDFDLEISMDASNAKRAVVTTPVSDKGDNSPNSPVLSIGAISASAADLIAMDDEPSVRRNSVSMEDMQNPWGTMPKTQCSFCARGGVCTVCHQQNHFN